MNEIEEYAFKEVRELSNIDKDELLEIIDFLQKDRKQWIEQFTKTHNESIDLARKYNKALQLLTGYNLPCDIDDFNTKEENIDYCSQNCSVDESIFVKCWNRYIEQEFIKSDGNIDYIRYVSYLEKEIEVLVKLLKILANGDNE